MVGKRDVNLKFILSFFIGIGFSSKNAIRFIPVFLIPIFNF